MAKAATERNAATGPSPEALHTRLGYLVASMPDLPVQPVPKSTEQWLANAFALVSAVCDEADTESLRRAIHRVQVHHSGTADVAAKSIRTIVYRALALADLRAPTVAQGSFIPAGSAFDAMGAIGKVLQPATASALIVDPYMDEKALTDFAVLVAPGVAIRLLADEAGQKPSLKSAVTRWNKQYGLTRPLEARLAPRRTLHDRLIIVDDSEVWVLTQSLNAFAERSPASIVRVDPETASLKIMAYSATWQAATLL